MADSSMSESLLEVLQCGVCLDTLEDPRSLHCAHTFCLKCLEGLQYRSRRLTCPTCRQKNTLPVSGLPEDIPKPYKLNSIQNLLLESTKIPAKQCESCSQTSEPLSAFCLQCRASLCSSCVTQHRKHERFSGHQCQSMAEVRFCPCHQREILDTMCLSCTTVICCLCLIKQHSNHDTANLSDTVDNMRKQLFEFVSRARTYDSSALAAHSKYLDTIRAEWQINLTKFKQSTWDLKEKIEQMLPKADDTITQGHKDISELAEKVTGMKRLATQAEELLNSTSSGYDVYEKAKDILSSVVNIPDVYRPEIPLVHFNVDHILQSIETMKTNINLEMTKIRPVSIINNSIENSERKRKSSTLGEHSNDDAKRLRLSPDQGVPEASVLSQWELPAIHALCLDVQGGRIAVRLRPGCHTDPIRVYSLDGELLSLLGGKLNVLKEETATIYGCDGMCFDTTRKIFVCPVPKDPVFVGGLARVSESDEHIFEMQKAILTVSQIMYCQESDCYIVGCLNNVSIFIINSVTGASLKNIYFTENVLLSAYKGSWVLSTKTGVHMYSVGSIMLKKRKSLFGKTCVVHSVCLGPGGSLLSADKDTGSVVAHWKAGEEVRTTCLVKPDKSFSSYSLRITCGQKYVVSEDGTSSVRGSSVGDILVLSADKSDSGSTIKVYGLTVKEN